MSEIPDAVAKLHAEQTLKLVAAEAEVEMYRANCGCGTSFDVPGKDHYSALLRAAEAERDTWKAKELEGRQSVCCLLTEIKRIETERDTWRARAEREERNKIDAFEQAAKTEAEREALRECKTTYDLNLRTLEHNHRVEITTLSADMEALQDDRDALRKQVGWATQEFTRVCGEIDEANGALDALQTQNRKLREAIEKARGRCDWDGYGALRILDAALKDQP